MKYPRRLVWMPALLASLAASTAAADPDDDDKDKKCDLSVNVGNVTVNWNQNFEFQAVTFTVHKKKKRACDYQVFFSKGGASNYNRRMINWISSLNYQLFKNSGLTEILKDRADATSAQNFISGSFPEGKDLTKSATFYFQIPLNLATTPTIKPSGIYMDTVAVSVYQAGVVDLPGNGQADDVVSVNLTAIIPKILEISIVNTGGTFDPNSRSKVLDFGALSEGQQKSLDLLLRTNAGYSVSLSSQNGGKLKRTSSPMTTVNYTFSANGSNYSLANPVVIAQGSGQTSMNGVKTRMDMTIGSTDSGMSGSYQDVITVTVTNTE